MNDNVHYRSQRGSASRKGFAGTWLVEAAQTAVRYDAELGLCYRRLAVRNHRAVGESEGGIAGWR